VIKRDLETEYEFI